MSSDIGMGTQEDRFKPMMSYVEHALDTEWVSRLIPTYNSVMKSASARGSD